MLSTYSQRTEFFFSARFFLPLLISSRGQILLRRSWPPGGQILLSPWGAVNRPYLLSGAQGNINLSTRGRVHGATSQPPIPARKAGTSAGALAIKVTEGPSHSEPARPCSVFGSVLYWLHGKKKRKKAIIQNVSQVLNPKYVPDPWESKEREARLKVK